MRTVSFNVQAIPAVHAPSRALAGGGNAGLPLPVRLELPEAATLAGTAAAKSGPVAEEEDVVH